ncbi:MAG: hypothetical protein JJU00_19255 [Opitutales bacterium]|nr:hypothetical protein [Opitutales bacterium]
MIVIEKLTLGVYVFCRDCGRIRKSLRERVAFVMFANFIFFCSSPLFAVFYLIGRGPTPQERILTALAATLVLGTIWTFFLEPKINFDKIRDRAHAPNRVLLNVLGGFVFFFWIWWLMAIAALPKPDGL